ncbi:MAG TPA: ABC transporter ATP-binding protein [Alphaproteobacteria bacterium]|nr:ABC transporter ATP-binding protein [Alphaproteobacteria bacterium]
MSKEHTSSKVLIRSFRFGLRQWRHHPRDVAIVVLGMLAATLAEIAAPVFAGRLVDALAVDASVDAAAMALAIIVLLGAAAVLLRDRAARAIIRLTSAIMKRVTDETFWRVQRFSTDWHANSFAGATVRSITRGVWALDLFNDVVLVGVFPVFVVLVGVSGLLGWRWGIVGAAVAASVVAYLAISAAMLFWYVAPRLRRTNAMDSRLGGSLADSITCNAVVKSFGAERREDAAIARLTRVWRFRLKHGWDRDMDTYTTQTIFMTLVQGGVLGLVLWMWSSGRATAGDFAYVLATYALINGYLREIGYHLRNLQRSLSDMEGLVDFTVQPLGIADRPDARPIAIGRGCIAFDRVTFRYRGQDKPIYRDFSLTIEPGERIGLVGYSGSGKSTFVKLVQRLYDVEGGRILIDGQDIAAATQESLRRQIALVPQEPVLFHRTLAENIAYGRPKADRAAIIAAAKKAHAHGFVAQLPHGYDTLVGERGVKLSGGERQRVALARAILADAPILILDEATSSLDSLSEALIQDAVERLMANRTTIVIAHRLSTVQRMDRILVFDRGEIVEQGSHADLVRREGGYYRALFEKQALGLIDGFEEARQAEARAV